MYTVKALGKAARCLQLGSSPRMLCISREKGFAECLGPTTGHPQCSQEVEEALRNWEEVRRPRHHHHHHQDGHPPGSFLGREQPFCLCRLCLYVQGWGYCLEAWEKELPRAMGWGAGRLMPTLAETEHVLCF
jgi:hypothetical protein